MEPLLLLPEPKPTLPTADDFQDYNIRRSCVDAYGFLGFCIVYLPHYFYLEPATFHKDMALEIENPENRMLEIIGGRGTAKSVYGSLAFVLYAALEKPQQYPFIIPIADTGTQASVNIANIKEELENNDLIQADYGRAKLDEMVTDNSPEISAKGKHLESDEQWQAKNMLLANGVRILARSRGQKVRGLRHREHRPKLIVVDDPEDAEWVQQKKNRNKTARWMQGEVIPALDELVGRLIVIGNFLHDDAIMMRLKKTKQFKVLEYPLIKNGYLQWPSMYPTQGAIDKKRTMMGEVAWMREMLLIAVPEEGQEVKPDDIHYYDREPVDAPVSITGHGVDLAISTKESADYTTDVRGRVRYVDEHPRVYIQPNPLNAHLDFYSTIGYFAAIPNRSNQKYYVEDVAYQKAAIQEMERRGLPVTAIRPTKDKRSRLRVASIFIKNGTVQFPRNGCEDLIRQVLNFGIEEHDDLVDGLTNLILGLVEEGLDPQRVVGIDV